MSSSLSLSLRTYHIAPVKEGGLDNESIKTAFIAFADKYGLEVGVMYIEPKRCTTLKNSQLHRLLSSCHQNDMVLIQDTTVFNKLNRDGWQELYYLVKAKAIRLVVMAIPSTWQAIKDTHQYCDDENGKQPTSLSSFMIEVLASNARYTVIRNKQVQAAGIKQAQLAGRYKGRKPDLTQYKIINELLAAGKSYKEIESELQCSSSTIAKAKKWQRGVT